MSGREGNCGKREKWGLTYLRRNVRNGVQLERCGRSGPKQNRGNHNRRSD